MSENETSNRHESILKNFTLPGKVPIEDLMSKYSGTLEITFGIMSGIIDKHLQKAANGKDNHYDDGHEEEEADEREQDEQEEDENDLSVLDISNGRSPRTEITNGRNKTNNKNDKNNNDGDDEFRENNRNIDDQSDCVIISSSVSVFKTPARNSKRPSRSLTVDKTPNASTTSKTKPKTTATAAAASTTTTTTSTNTASRTGKRKREASEEAGEAKPGTLGSRQTIPTQSRESKLNRLTVQCNDLIDTKNLVTNDIVVSLQELCQRAKIKKVPDDPTDLLMKFSIIIPRLSEMDAYIEK